MTRGSTPKACRPSAPNTPRENNIALFYFRYLSGAIHGDLGFSRSLNRPVSELLKERLPLTLGSLAYGVLGGMSIGLVLALASVWWHAPGSDLVPAVAERPVAGVTGGPDRAGLPLDGRGRPLGHRLGGFPARLSLRQESSGSRVPGAARAGGAGQRTEPRPSAFCACLHPAAPQLAALAGISVSLAFGASIPIEVICDTPGVGQLAWKAALDRDLPLLVNITVLVTLMTLVVNACADLALARWRTGAMTSSCDDAYSKAGAGGAGPGDAGLAGGRISRAVFLLRAVSRRDQRSAFGCDFCSEPTSWAATALRACCMEPVFRCCSPPRPHCFPR